MSTWSRKFEPPSPSIIFEAETKTSWVTGQFNLPCVAPCSSHRELLGMSIFISFLLAVSVFLVLI